MEESAKHDKTVMKNRLIWLFAFPLGVSIMIFLGGYLYMNIGVLGSKVGCTISIEQILSVHIKISLI